MRHALTLTLAMDGGYDMRDLTDRVRTFVEDAAIDAGCVVVFSRHTTAGLLVMEWRDTIRTDLIVASERLAPRGTKYQHTESHGAHIAALIANANVTIPIVGGRLQLGTWQSIVFIDFDTDPRTREVMVQIVPT